LEGIVGPVGAKFKLQYDTCSNSYGKIDNEKGHPELGGLLPFFVADLEINGLHDGNNKR